MAFDKLYWLRVGLAVLAGVGADVLVGTDYFNGISLGIAVYLASFYLVRYTWYKGIDRQSQGKIYSTGIGSFALVFLFTWMLMFTLQAVGFSV
jgi:hypothetical protein